MLFSKKEGAKPQLQQKEREAIVDLLHLCLYADAHVAVKEGEFLSGVVDVIGWETRSSFGSYEARSVANARAARGTAELTKEFIADAASRLHSKAARALAIDLCRQLLAADGTTEDKETSLFAQIRAALA